MSETVVSRPPRRGRVIVLIVLALALLSASFYLTNFRGEQTIVVTFPGGREVEAEVADTPEKIFFGLAFRDQLPRDWGMLYIFETSDRHRLRTKGFKFPVDIIWVDEHRRVVHLVEQAEPCAKDPCPLYGPPPENARYAIETAAGFVKQAGVVPGAELKFTLRM